MPRELLVINIKRVKRLRIERILRRFGHSVRQFVSILCRINLAAAVWQIATGEVRQGR